MSLDSRERRLRPDGAAQQNHTPGADGTAWYRIASRWDEFTAWWLDVRLAYAKGVKDGVEMERARREAEDDLIHRTAVERLERFVEAADRRAACDRGEVGA